MYKAVLANVKRQDAVLMAAAVADFTPITPAGQKIKKNLPESEPEIRLTTTPDILASLGDKKSHSVLVGFALETEHGLENAKTKLREKNLDFIVLNSVTKKHSAIGSDTNVVTIIDKSGKTEQLPEMPKFDVANRILDKVRGLL
jgi:phosphopantothenoylcysteine decarboxylase/phosphopantothenate--cysteine ligase